MVPTDLSWREHCAAFIFGPVNPWAAAVFRIALAGMLVAGFWSQGLSLAPGWRCVSELSSLYKSLFLSGGYWLMALVAVILLAAGIRPRLASLLLILWLFPLAFLTSGQQSRQILLFSLLAFSFVRSDVKLGFGKYQAGAGPIWPIRLIQWQLTAVYGINALAKTTPAYLSGEVLMGMSQARPNFLVDLSEGYLQLGPVSLPVVLLAVTSTFVEYFLALGFWWRRLRWVAAAVGFLFHVILTQFVQIYMLDWVCMFLYLSFLLPFEVSRQDVVHRAEDSHRS